MFFLLFACSCLHIIESLSLQHIHKRTIVFVNEPDASDDEEEDSTPDLVDLTDSSDDEDAMTNDGEEHEAEHPESEIRWHPSAQWKREAVTDPWKKQFGELVWHAPARRDGVKSLPGPEQEYTFDVDLGRTDIDLFRFDSLLQLPSTRVSMPISNVLLGRRCATLTCRGSQQQTTFVCLLPC